MSILKKVYIFFVDLAETFVLVGAVFLIVYAFLFRPYQVNGKSMDPNFHDEEYVLTNLISIRFSELSRGDVIVFTSYVEKDYIKRIIGLPGDKVLLRDGKVYINDHLLDENKYLSPDIKTQGGYFIKEGIEFSVPEDQYFVLGDNREVSSDSREWGFVKKEKIIGKSFFVYWPLKSVRVINEVKYNL